MISLPVLPEPAYSSLDRREGRNPRAAFIDISCDKTRWRATFDRAENRIGPTIGDRMPETTLTDKQWTKAVTLISQGCALPLHGELVFSLFADARLEPEIIARLSMFSLFRSPGAVASHVYLDTPAVKPAPRRIFGMPARLQRVAQRFHTAHPRAEYVFSHAELGEEQVTSIVGEWLHCLSQELGYDAPTFETSYPG